MDKLNLECLEHIFGFLNCGPREWLVLSKVCTKWQDAVTRFWRRIDRIKVDDSYHEYNPRSQFLSTKMVTAILKFATKHVREINITKHKKINNIKLGNQTYNLNGLNINAFMESFAKYSSGQILKAVVLADDHEFLNVLMKSNGNLKELNLKLNVDSFAEMKCWQTYCPKLCKQILESFSELERITVTFAETFKLIKERNLYMLNELLLSLSGRSTPKEFQVEIPCGHFEVKVLSVLNRYCSRKMILPRFSAAYSVPFMGYLNITFSNFSQRLFEITFVTVRFKHMPLFRESIRSEIRVLFNEVIPSLQKLKLLVDTVWTTSWEIKKETDFKYLFVSAVNLAIFHDRKVVINEVIEIVKNIDRSQCVNTQPLYITISPTVEGTEEFQNFLEQKFSDCTVTAKL